MTPCERELAHKTLLSPMITSINDDNDEGTGRTRTKYLNRTEAGEDGHSSDTEPLLQ
jgi:hypothetical protein